MLELPAGAPTRYKMVSPYKQDVPKALQGRVKTGTPVTITLKPFQVLVIEALPRNFP